MKMHTDDVNAGQIGVNQAGSEIVRQRAAAYVRMSTDHQQYSTRNQLDVIREYARQHNWEIVQEYSDAGKSGLTIKGRAALGRMIRDAIGKNANFNHILVYDVSRWGRFQDPDEAAHYEFICREAGLSVHYCAEQFENDGGLNSTIAKNLKRVLAGEYSRELSVKVFQGASRMIRMGYKQGGSALYGLRRMLVDQNGRHKLILKFGERKNLQTDRVIYIPGPEAEIKVVRWIFEAFVNERKGQTEITRQLNQSGLLPESERRWRVNKVRYVLNNEKYIGNLVYFRTSIKLRSQRIVNPPEVWVRKENAFAGIVPPELFFKAQEILEANRKKYRYCKKYMLEKLRVILAEHGYLSSNLLERLKQTPHPLTFRNRFGSLTAAYRLVGFNPRETGSHREITRRLFKINQRVIDEIISQIKQRGGTATWNRIHHTLLLNQELRVWVIFIRHKVTPLGASRWFLRRKLSHTKSDLTLAVRMDRHDESIQDYYLLPGLENSGNQIYLGEQNKIDLDAYRFQSLDFLVGMAVRIKCT